MEEEVKLLHFAKLLQEFEKVIPGREGKGVNNSVTEAHLAPRIVNKKVKKKRKAVFVPFFFLPEGISGPWPRADIQGQVAKWNIVGPIWGHWRPLGSEGNLQLPWPAVPLPVGSQQRSHFLEMTEKSEKIPGIEAVSQSR